MAAGDPDDPRSPIGRGERTAVLVVDTDAALTMMERNMRALVTSTDRVDLVAGR